jgi:hypothetical protein
MKTKNTKNNRISRMFSSMISSKLQRINPYTDPLNTLLNSDSETATQNKRNKLNSFSTNTLEKFISPRCYDC